MSTPRRILVCVAWPYANGYQHLGHIAGAYLPADIFARYHRRSGNEVLMVSGSDAHGTPITVRADQEGVEPGAIVERFHPAFLETWERLGISFDLFTTTMTDTHRRVVQELFERLRDNGYIRLATTEQLYDEQVGRFLPDRYVEGTCPHCGYPQARGDQCENCGRTLDPEDLIEPKSRLTGTTPTRRPTEHWFLALSKLADPLLAWLRERRGWRRHVINWTLQFVEDGLIDRSITRDLVWGVPLPDDAAIGEGKRIYVWFEAVIGYLSASQEWAERSGNPDAWKRYWQDPEAESYYFIGKDNIIFHTVIWPAILLGAGDLNLPTDVPANQYVTFGGAKASKSAGVGRYVQEYLDALQPDELRYAVASVLPEQNDTELSDDEIVSRINDELVATWGNLVNRVLALTAKHFDGLVPEPGPLEADDVAVVDTARDALVAAGEHLDRVELRAGLRRLFSAAQAVNAYLNRYEPWKTAGTDRQRTATTLHQALAAIAVINVGLSPYLPFSAAEVERVLGLEPGGWEPPTLTPGAALAPSGPLFRKIRGALFPE